MKKLGCIILSFVLALGCLTGCSNNSTEVTQKEDFNYNVKVPTYSKITPETAKELMDTETNYIILDVRTQEEYNEGHIKGATLLPHEEIEAKADEVLPDKNQLILVHCRSGARSKVASDLLVALGYTNVKDFGGLNNWPYEIEK